MKQKKIYPIPTKEELQELRKSMKTLAMSVADVIFTLDTILKQYDESFKLTEEILGETE